MNHAAPGNLLSFFRAKHDVRSVCTSPGVLRFFFLVIIFLLLTKHRALAQQEGDYAVHANIIYHFTKYIDWPEYKKMGDFIIGVVGAAALYDKLKKNITGKTVGTQKIVVKQFSASAVIFNCHILFISDDESGSMKKIVSRTAGTSVLLVSESAGLAQKGGCINFIIVSDHLKLEINRNNIEGRGLSIASELLKLGKLVK
jgi:YfiR/HmsC-like